MDFSMAVGTKQHAFVQLAHDSIPRGQAGGDRELLGCRVRMMKNASRSCNADTRRSDISHPYNPGLGLAKLFGVDLNSESPPKRCCIKRTVY